MPDAGHSRGKRHEQRGDGRSDMVIWTATPPVFTSRLASRGRSRTRRPERRRNRRLAPGVVRHRRAELLPPALAKVRAALPHLEISLRVADRDQALSTLRQGTLDLAVIEVHTPPAEMDRDLIYALCSATRSGSSCPAATAWPKAHHQAHRRRRRTLD